MERATIGYVMGVGGRFGRLPFYSVRFGLPQCKELDGLLAKSGAQRRRTTTLTASFHQPNRLRLTEVNPPDYEFRAAACYVRGDVIRVQGKEGVSCGLDLSARFGVPIVREQLGLAMAKAREYVELRVPSRKRDVIEFIPDTELNAPVSDEDALIAGSVGALTDALPPEDFSDWEK
jgi:hypothetical protein